MKDSDYHFALALICAVFASLGLAATGLAKSKLNDRYESIRKQAIERGHAEYVVDSDGETTWQWKEEK
jgi:hypothetical protein